MKSSRTFLKEFLPANCARFELVRVPASSAKAGYIHYTSSITFIRCDEVGGKPHNFSEVDALRLIYSVC